MARKPTRNVTKYVDLLNQQVGRTASLGMVGFLHPLVCDALGDSIRLDQTDVLIGRSDIEIVDLSLPDSSVSREHARLMRRGNDYWIVDLDSSNGTFVDGVPVHTCLLHGGDAIQIGESLFLFERRLERDGLTLKEAASRSGSKARLSMPEATAQDESLAICFWGTRGSIPTPGERTRIYGGNTTCIEIRHKATSIVIDAGSGIREMSNAWEEAKPGVPLHTHLLFTHLHWDHIQGFPFWKSAYNPQNTIDIYGAIRETGSPEELLSGQMRGAYFPVPISAMSADLRFRKMIDPFEIDDLKIAPFELPHPGGCLGFRIRAEEQILIIATDCELDQVTLNREERLKDDSIPPKFDPDFLENFKDAHLIVVDCQYTDEEYSKKQGWGHNSIEAVVNLCLQVSPRAVALTHHDPESTDEMVSACAKEVSERLRRRGNDTTLAFAAREGLTLSAGESPRPALIEMED